MFQPYKVSSDVRTGWIHGRGMTLNPRSCSQWMDWKAHQLGRKITCDATFGSEANEKLEVKAKGDD